MTPAGRCPYLGLAGNRNHQFAVASPRHRCYVRHQAERIGCNYQAAHCLTSAYRRCPRLTAEAERHLAQESEPAPSPPPPGSSMRAIFEPARLAEPSPRAGAAGRYTDLVPAPTRRAKRPRRTITWTEGAVVSLGIAILLACSFIGYALLYRRQVGPGMAAGPLLAEGAGPTAAEARPTPIELEPISVEEGATSAQERPTLVPTFTPTPTPTPTRVTPTPDNEPPTPIPEPTLPVPTPVGRLPAASPPTRLVIDKIGLDIPVVPVGIKTINERGKPKRVWADVPNAGAFHETSAYPGHPGNTVINGHRDIQGAVFRQLDRVEQGDEIVVYASDVAYPYQVTEVLVVPETFASAEQRTENLRLISYLPEERLTLITCTPVGLATHRLLVIARPLDQVPPQMPEAGSTAQP